MSILSLSVHATKVVKERRRKKEREKKTDKEAINQSRGVTLDRSVSSYVEHTTLVYLPI